MEKGGRGGREGGRRKVGEGGGWGREREGDVTRCTCENSRLCG